MADLSHRSPPNGGQFGYLGRSMSERLRGDRVTLRPMAKDDLHLLHRWLNDPDVMQYWDGRDHPATFDRVEVRFRRSVDGSDREAIRYMIDVEGGPCIGMVQYGRINPRAKNTQIDLLIGEREFRDTGYGAEAMRALLNHLFVALKVHRVWFTIRASNDRAMRGAERAGFRNEGVLREHDQLEGQFVDVAVYGMLRSEWKG